MLRLLLLSLVALATAQDVVQVNCELDAITIRLDKNVVSAAGFGMEDVHLNDNNCPFEGEDGDFYVKRIEPFTGCGTVYTVNDTHVVYQNSLSTVDTGKSYPYGVVVGSQANSNVLSALVTCTYNIDLRVSTMFIPNITVIYVPLPDAHGEGNFRATMNLYTDERYFTPYLTPPVMQAEATLFVGVNLIGDDISSDIYLLMEDCWATVYEEPDSMPQYPLITDGCAETSSAEGTVRVRNNGDSHQGLWQSAVFKFVGAEPEYNNVWLHCDLQLCIQDKCLPQCARRRRRAAGEILASVEQPNIVSIGPITKRTTITIDPHGSGTVVMGNNTRKVFESNAPGVGLSPALLITVGALAALCVICITVAIVLIALRMQRNARNAEMVNGGNINKAFHT